MRFLTFVYRNIARRPIRSALTVSGMAIAVAAVVALVGIAEGFRRSFLELYQGQGIDIIVVRARTTDRMTSELDQSLGERIAKIPNLATVEPVLLDSISLEDLGVYGVVLQGLQSAAANSPEQNMIAGRVFQPGESRVVMLGQILARNLDKQVGDTIEIYEGEKFQVVGIYDRHNIFENGAVIIPLADLQSLLGQTGRVTAFNLTVQKPTSVAEIRDAVRQIEALGLGVSALPTEEYVATESKIRIASAMAWSTSAIALIVGGIGMLNTMIVSVFERTHEIGVLRAIGWRTSRIVRMILLESGVLSVVGAVIGVGLALLFTYALSRAPATSGLVDARLSPTVMLQGFVLALLIGMVGAVYPACRAARLLPTVALRGEG